MTIRILVGCEFSGTVRQAFASLGFDAWSCDYEPSELPGNHLMDDVLNIACRGRWDLLIAHPPCTNLAASGSAWFAQKGDRPDLAVEFVRELMALPIPHIAIENPIGYLSTQIRKPDQIIQPWWFGEDTTKATCLWLKDLPPLKPTNPVITVESNAHQMGETKSRAKNRSRTYLGVAKAMAEQWGRYLVTRSNP
jgi:hypothetical protein